MARGRERGSQRGKATHAPVGAPPRRDRGVAKAKSRLGGAPTLRLLGKLSVSQGVEAISLPASRKVLGLLAYLAMAPRPLGRSQLCELLWDVPNDPRGELRWCLSKIRGVIGPRVVTAADAIALDLTGCEVDALIVEQAARDGIEKLSPARQRELAAMIRGEFLEGLEIERSPAFGAWVTAQRRRFRAVQAALLEQLAGAPDDDEAFAYLEQWLELSPFDRRVHELLLTRLAARGRLREGEEHLGRAEALFETEGLDSGPIREVWRSAKTPRITAVGAPHGRDAFGDNNRAHGALLQQPAGAHRASIAVMPFADHSGAAARSPTTSPRAWPSCARCS
jgi:DNA-binding SARP family transcriptional activator